MLHIEQQTQQGKMSGKSSKNKRPIICAARPKQLYFKLPYFMSTFIGLFSLFFAIYGGVWKQSHTIPIIIHHIENSYKKFSSRIVKKCTSCTFFNSKFVKQTCYCVEPRTSCPIVVVPPFFKNTLHHTYTFCRFGFAAYRHGWWWFQTVVSFSLEKLIVEQCTRTYTAQQPVAAQPHRQKRHGCRWFHATATFEASPQTRR